MLFNGGVFYKRILIFFSVLFMFNFASAVRVELNLENVEQSAHQRYIAYVGETFQIKATVRDGDRDTDTLKVEGLDKFVVSGKSQATSVSMINNRLSSQIEHLFDVQAAQEGEFVIGPANVIQNGTKINSNTVTLLVKNRPAGQPVQRSRALPERSTRAEAEGCEVFCDLKVDSQKVVVGQPVVLSALVHARGNILQLGIEPPKLKDFLVREIEQVARRQENVEGKLFEVIDKKYLLLPLQQGVKEIPSLKVEFSTHLARRRRGGFFEDDFFSGFWGPSIEQKKVFSTSLKIEVDSLPKHSGNVDAVGQFTNFEVKVDKNEVMVNEPIALTINIEGMGNLQQISYPKLKLPSVFKHYESKFNVNEDLSVDYKGGSKHFEYVIQVGKDGVFTIPGQTFTFFDTKTRSYKSLKSKEIELKINPAYESQSIPNQNSQGGLFDRTDGKEGDDSKSYVQDIHFIEDEKLTFREKEMNIPWYLFIILLLLPVVFFSRSILVSTWNKFAQMFLGKYSAKRSLAEFNNRIDIIVKKGEIEDLYQLFLNFFAVKFDVEQSMVTQDFIGDKLLEESWDLEKISKFLDYLNECASFHFASKLPAEEEKNRLLKKAKYWFLMLNK